MDTLTTFTERALVTIAQGVPVIRLRPRTKIALDSNWPSLATTDLHTIHKWNSETPDANCGAVAKLEIGAVFFFEIDSNDVLLRIKSDTGKDIPSTFRVRSSPGRGHIYLRHTPKSVATGNISQGFVKNGDWSLRCGNEYACSPLSVHPKTGEPYTIMEDSPVADAPDWLMDWCASQKVVEKKTAAAEAGPIPDGQRNVTLSSIAGKCRNLGMSRDDMEEYLLKVNAERCVPALPEKEVQAIAWSYARYPAGDPLADVLLIGGKLAGSPASTLVTAADAAPTWQQSFRAVQELEEGEVRMLIDGFLPEGVTFIGALPGEGKTLLGLSIAKALTTGQDFLGRFSVPEKVPVIYMIPESGGRAFRKRCERFHIPNDRALFICRTVSEGATIGLDDPILLEAVRRMKPVVILDTLIRFSNSKDENSSMENKQLTEGMTGLRQAGAIGVIALHHSTKTMRTAGMSLETVLRGTGDIAAFPDAVYGMLRDGRLYDHGNGPNEVDVECVKPRDFDPPLPFRIAASRRTTSKAIGQAPGIESVIDRLGDFQPVNRDAVQTNRDAELVRMVQEDPAMTIKELSDATGMPNWSIRKALQRLGWTKQKGGAKGAHQWTVKAQSGVQRVRETLKGGPEADVILQ